MHFWCDKIFSYHFNADILLSLPVKEFENWLLP